MAGTASQISAASERNWAFDLSPDLRLEATCEATSAIVADFFAGYDRAFVLEDEKEPLAGFTECLALNHGAAYDKLVARYGAFREIVLVARAADGARIGGANFISFPLAAPGTPPSIGANLNYIYVDKGARSKGRLKALLAGIAGFIPRLFTAPALPALIFIEQNDPFRMSDEAYALDTSYAGVDQFDRLAIWLHEGARIVDFHYVQPPLGPLQKPDDSLVYAVLSPPEARLSACLLREHLQRFFAISVLKGRAPERYPNVTSQLQSLAENCAKGTLLELLDMPSSMIEGAKQARAQAEGRPDSLRAFIRGEAGK